MSTASRYQKSICTRACAFPRSNLISFRRGNRTLHRRSPKGTNCRDGGRIRVRARQETNHSRGQDAQKKDKYSLERSETTGVPSIIE
ncbi:unnamed protein product [Jaminaea pallidilutea]